MGVIAWKDWKTKRIPDRYIVYAFAIGIISLFFYPEIGLPERMKGMFAVSIPLLALAGLVPGSIGGGDIKLMAAGGFILGIARIWNAFVTGVMSAGAYVAVLLIARKAGRKTEIALGPFLSFGMIVQIMNI